MRNNLLNSFSLEADADQVVTTPGEEIIDGEIVNNDVVQTTADIQELEVAIDSAEDAAKALEQVQEFIEDAQEKGGLSDGEAKLAQVATEALLARFGGHVSVNFPSLESFGSAGGRATATAFTLESIGEKIKQIWEAIKKWVKEFVQKIKDWFRAQFSAAGKLEKAGKELVNKAREKVGTPDEKTFSLSGSERKYLTITANQTDVSTNIGKLESDAKDLWTNKTLAEVKETNKTVMAALKDIDVDNIESLKKLNTALPKAEKFKKQLRTLAGVKGEDINFVSPDVEFGMVHGNVRVRYAPDKVSVISASYSFVPSDTKTDSFGTEKSLKALDLPDIIKVGEAIEIMGKTMLNQQKILSSENELTKKAIAEIDKISSKLEKTSKDDREKFGSDTGYKTVLALVKNSSAYLVASEKSEATVMTHSTAVARSWLSFAKRSLSNIKDKKA